MSKIDDVIAMLKEGHGGTNAEIAREVDCDEGIVRRARPLAQIAMLEEQIIAFREENASLKERIQSCRCNPGLPPRGRRPRPEPLRMLWEREENGEYQPFIPMLGESS